MPKGHSSPSERTSNFSAVDGNVGGDWLLLGALAGNSIPTTFCTWSNCVAVESVAATGKEASPLAADDSCSQLGPQWSADRVLSSNLPFIIQVPVSAAYSC
jgi:hypothetical protein